MRQLLVAAARPGAVLELAGADYHYLIRVLRLAAGAVIPVVDGAGRRAQATVTEIGAATVRLRVATAADPGATAGTAGAPVLTLIQALPKATLMDRIVRQATELGVARIVPVVAERTQGRADGTAQTRRWERWRRIARQAAQQSGAAPPIIAAAVPLRDYLEQRVAGDPAWLFQPGATPLLPGAAFGAPGRAGASCAVGPEGGFSPAEAELFRRHGFRAVGLPTGILRVDTAAVAALTAAGQVLLATRRMEAR